PGCHGTKNGDGDGQAFGSEGMHQSAKKGLRRQLGSEFELFGVPARPGGLRTRRAWVILPMPSFPFVRSEAEPRRIFLQAKPIEEPGGPPLLLFFGLITIRNLRPLRALLYEIDGNPSLV